MDRAGVPADQRPQDGQQGQALAGTDRLGQGNHAECRGGLHLPAAWQARTARRGTAIDPGVRLPAGTQRSASGVNFHFMSERAAARMNGGDGLGVTSGLRRRLLVMLISPLVILALLNAWFDYRSADNAALQQDQRLLALVPLLADSIIG